MSINYGYAFQNTKRDLSDILNTINKGRIGFITLFGTGPKATNHKVEWLQDELKARSITVSANSSGTLTICGLYCARMCANSPKAAENTNYATISRACVPSKGNFLERRATQKFVVRVGMRQWRHVRQKRQT